MNETKRANDRKERGRGEGERGREKKWSPERNQNKDQKHKTIFPIRTIVACCSTTARCVFEIRYMICFASTRHIWYSRATYRATD